MILQLEAFNQTAVGITAKFFHTKHWSNRRNSLMPYVELGFCQYCSVTLLYFDGISKTQFLIFKCGAHSRNSTCTCFFIIPVFLQTSFTISLASSVRLLSIPLFQYSFNTSSCSLDTWNLKLNPYTCHKNEKYIYYFVWSL